MEKNVVALVVASTLFCLSLTIEAETVPARQSKIGALKALDQQFVETVESVLDSLRDYHPMVERLSEVSGRTACNTMAVGEYRQPLEDMERGIARAANILKTASALVKKGKWAPKRLRQAVKDGALFEMQKTLQQNRLLLAFLAEIEKSCNTPL